MALNFDNGSGGLLGYILGRLQASANDNGEDYSQPTPPLNGDAVRAYLADRAAQASAANGNNYMGGYATPQPAPQAPALPQFGEGAAPVPYLNGQGALGIPQLPQPAAQPAPQPVADRMVVGAAGDRPIPTNGEPVPPLPRGAQFAQQEGQQEQASQPALSLPQSLGGAFWGMLGGLARPGSPLANAQMQQRILAAKVAALNEDKTLTNAQKLAILTNPKVEESLLGPAPPNTIEAAIAREIGRSHGVSATQGMAILNEMKKQSAASEAIGKAQGGNAAGALNSMAQMDQTIASIDALAKDPTLTQVVGGPIVGRNPGLTGHQEATLARIHQLEGQLVTNVMQSFKGTGIRLTQQEVNQLQRGVSRIGEAARTQDIGSYREALSELRQQIVGMRERIGLNAGGEATPSPNATPPSGFTQGQLMDEARKRGLLK